MYHLRSERANQITGATWMIGLGILLITGYWFPGIFFVIGAGMLVQSLVDGRGWYSAQGAWWMIALGVWFMLGAGVGTLFILIGISLLIGAILRPPFLAKKPYVDNTLE